jgi:anti-sigma B factor antagonist
MEISKQYDDGTLTITLGGKMDTLSSPELEKELTDLSGVTRLILNLSNLTYVSSAGLRVILMAHKKMKKQGELRIVHPAPFVKEVFDMTGFSKILTIED